MPRTIITHIGISVLECEAIRDAKFDINGLRDDLLSGRDRLWEDERRGRPSESLNQCSADLIDGLRKNWIAAYDLDQRLRSSPAEIASLSLLKSQQGDRIVLLHSDTPNGRFCALLIKKALKEAAIPTNGYPDCTNIPVEVRQVDKLRVSEASQSDADSQGTSEMFVHQGLPNYVTHVWEEYQLLPKDGGELIFNITGGYKGLIPIARDLSMLLTSHASEQQTKFASELCYLYQDSKDLIRIPAMPPKLEWLKLPAESLAIIGDDQGVAAERIPKEDKAKYSAYFSNTQEGIALPTQPSSELVNATALREILTGHFDDGELRTLCFDLNIDYESLPGQGKSDKARELVAYVMRHGRIDKLMAKCRELRPHVDWQNVVQAIPAKQLQEHRTNRIHRSVVGEVVWTMGKLINDPLKLNGTQVKAFRDALVDAFPNLSELRQMVRHQLNENLDGIVDTQNNLKGICFYLIEWSRAQGKTRNLLDGARKENPGNLLLERFAKQFDE